MVTAEPKGPARLVPYLAGGAALGIALRELCLSTWQLPAQRWVSVLLFAAVASFALGWMLTVEARPRLLAVVWGWSGTLSSISATTTFALGVTPLWGLSCMALVPLSAATGVAAGAVLSIRRHKRRRTAGERRRESTDSDVHRRGWCGRRVSLLSCRLTSTRLVIAINGAACALLAALTAYSHSTSALTAFGAGFCPQQPP